MNAHTLPLLLKLHRKVFRRCTTALIGFLALAFLVQASRAQTCAPVPDGLVSWWQAEGDPTDSVGGNDGTVGGNVTYATGEVGQAFSLDGNHSGLIIGSPINLQLQDFTIDAWVQRGSVTKASLDTGGGVLFGYGLSGYQFGMSDNGKLFLANAGSAAVASTVQVSDTAWHHVAVTKTGSSVIFYLDGVANPAPAFNTTFQFFTTACLGAQLSGGLKNTFLGLIDELDVFDHGLSAAEVQGIFNAGNFGKCTGNVPPTILTQPTSQTTVVGNLASFSVTATGSQPISYQWQLNGTNLAGATSPTLTLLSVQTTNAGNYSAVISSPFGQVTSANALLTVNPAGVCIPSPSGLVGWWQGEGNAVDLVGGNNGTPVGNVTFTNGEVGQAFKLDGNHSGLTVGNPASLQLLDFTIDAWVKRGSATQASLDAGGGVVFGYGSGGYELGIFDSGGIFLTQVGVSGQIVVSTVQVADTAWHHVAVTKSGNTVVFYVDGVANPAPAFGPTFQFTTTATIGALLGASLQNGFLGSIDELDVFNRALSASEIQTIYNSGGMGKCPNAPIIVTQPANQSTVVGNVASFSVTAAGPQPLSYQWQLNGTNLAGATSSSLNLLGVQITDAGNYSVIVSNPFGSATSANALLTVNVPTCTPTPSGLVSWWQGEGNALDTAVGNNGAPVGNVTYVVGEVGQAFNLDGNHSGLTVGNPANLQLQDFTIDAWIKRGSVIHASLDAGGGILFGYGNFGYQLGILDNGQLFLAQVSGPGQIVGSAVQVTDTAWHHVAVTKTGTTVWFYVDGVGHPAPAFGAVFSFTTTATIGALLGSSLQNSFLGSIDELDVYSRALSAAEVQLIYNAASSGKCPSPPAIVTQPASQAVAVGNTASWSVSVTGSQPLSYQWQLNGTNLAGATSPILTLANIQTTDAGNYSVTISNPYGSVTSASARLTVNLPGPCAPAPAGLVSWWQGEGNAVDSVGANNGTPGGNVTYSAGEVKQAFSLDGNHSGLTVGNPSSLQLQNFTIDAWIKRGSASHASLDTGGGVLFGYGSFGYQLGIFDNGQLFLAQVAVNGAVVGSAVQITDTSWHHVALTKNGTVVVFYLDGVGYPAPAFNQTFQFNSLAAIGALLGTGLQNSFLGSIDELDVFNRALSAAELQSLFNAGSSGKCPAPAVIVSQPAAQTVMVGNVTSFSVTAAGSQPLSYQWQLNGTNLIGATSPALILNNVQLTNAGNYSVTVTSPYGSVTSANALLTVNPATCTPLPSGLVSWWKAEGNALDSQGGNNGSPVGTAVVTYAAGEVGQAFSFNGNHVGVAVGNPANLQLQDFTIDAWVKRGSATLASLDNGGGVVFGYGSGGYQLGMFDTGQLFLSQVGGPGQAGMTAAAVTGTAWHHVAVTKSGSTVIFYVDGVGFQMTSAYSASFGFSSTATIGTLVLNGPQNSFLGLIDELDVFNRALSPAEVQAIYTAGTAGKCPSPPTIVTQPTPQSTVVGNSALFSVTAGGSPPLSYQWQFNGTSLTGATGRTLNLVNAQFTDAGNYSVIVSSPYGSVTSGSALLTVNPAGSCVPVPSGLVSWWPAEGNANDFAGVNNGTVIGNVTYTAGRVGQAFSLDGNPNGINVGNPANLQLQNFTIDAWVKRGSATQASLNSGGGILFSYGSGGYQLGILDNGQIFLSQSGVSGQLVESTAQAADTSWHHVAVTRSGSTVIFYLDGVAGSTAQLGTTFQFASSAAIGAVLNVNGTSIQNGFLGLIDEMDIFNRALSPSEVTTIYNASTAGKCPIAPAITLQPVGQTTVVGNTVSLSVMATGSPLLSYQWQLNGTNLAGASSATLSLVNIQTTNAGNYSVVVSSPYGSVTSTSALVTVNPAGSCAPAPAGLVSWWQGEGSPADFTGGNNGTVVGNVTYAAGEVGQAFNFDGNHSGVTVGNPANLQLQNFTIDAWVKRGSLAHASLDAGGGVIFGYGSGGYQLGVFDNGQLFLTQVAVSGQVIGSAVQLTDTGWHHIAVTKTGTVVVFYVDGVGYPAAPYSAVFAFNSTATVGTLLVNSLQNSFLGLIDELDVFNRALSAAEIQSIYAVSIAGKCTGNTPPMITSQPANQTTVAGNTASFNVTATGSQPLSYQWRFNGGNLTGATSPTLSLANAQTANAGNYSVVVSNPYGSVTSANALLTVNPGPACDPPPSGLVSWWQGEGNAIDVAGGNNGTPAGNVTYAAGKVGQAFSLDGNHSGLTVGNPANLQLQNFTIDAWIKRGSAAQASLDNGGGVVFGYGTGGYQLGMFDNGQMFLESVGNGYVGSTVVVPDTAWHHIAVSKNGSVVIFYLDGVADAPAALSLGFQFNSTAAIGGLLDNNLHNTFLGLIDELDVFNRNLSAAEVQSIFNAGSAGKCIANAPPVIVTQPVNQTTVAGNTVSFSVAATGVQPLSYQWQRNGTSLPGATSPTLALPNVQAADSGNYSVIVSNPYGSVTSANALLTVNPATCFPILPGLVSWWKGEGNATDLVGGNNGTTDGNVTYAAGEVGQAFSLDGNHSGITVGNPATLQLQDFTIDAWIKRGSLTKASIDAGGGTLFGYGSGGYELGMFDSGQLFLGQVGVSGQVVTSTILVSDSSWHHVALTKSGNFVVFYVDGTAYPASPMNVLFGFTTPATIGAQGTSFQNGFLGLIDEVDVFNRPLSAVEVQAIYNTGSAGKCTGNTAPVILVQPVAQSATVGNNTSFSVTAAGSPPLSYQWQLNGTNLAGATGAMLNLVNVQTTNAGNYSVTISNPSGMVISANALLTVMPPTCFPTPSGLVSWWQAEGTPSDAAGGNNGSVGGNVTYAAGEVGQAFSLDGNHSGLTVGSPPNLQLQNFTIDAWIKRGSVTRASLDAGGGILFGYGDRGYQFGVFDNGQIFLAWVGNGVVNSTIQLTDTAWHHVAVTKNGSSVVFYLDGVANAAPVFGPTFQFNSTAAIGALLTANLQNSFLGLIDELDVFNRALTTAEVQGIYNAGIAGKCTGNTPPMIVVQPVGQTTAVGNAVSFSVTASGSQPLSYQWQLNGTNLAGANGITLNLINVQTANTGNYSVVVSSPFGSVTSANALLTVSAGGTCTPAPSGLVSWWQGEGNPGDFTGANNGTVGGNVTYAPGKVGQAFNLDGNHSGITVGNPANLQLQNFTIDSWVKRGSVTHASQDSGGGVLFGYGAQGYQLGMFDNGQIFLVNVANGGVSSSVQVPDTAWHHVAVTKSGSSVVFYLDGVANPAAAFNTTFQFGSPATIGALSGNLQNGFLGLIDELDVFNRALSPAEIQAIYNAGAAGKCSGNVPPAILVQPANQTTQVGNTASFTVSASGSQPLSYQWQLNGANLLGATSQMLNLVNVQNSDAGNYSVVVSSPYGSVTSAGAVLTVNPITCVPAPSGLVSWWQGEGNALDVTGGNNGTPTGNVAYAPGKVGQAFSLDGNHSGITVGNAANLQLQDFTIEAWVKRGSAAHASQDSGGGVVFGYGTGGYQFAIADNGQMFLDQVGTPGQIVNSPVQVADTAWHHIAVTKTGLTVTFYLDGVLSPGPAMSVAFGFTTPATIGALSGTLQNGFLGMIDELDVFNRALSANEVQLIYNAGIAGKCAIPAQIVTQPASQTVIVGGSVTFAVVAGGSAPLNYQWTFSGTNIPGATSSSLALNNVQFNQAGSYAVVVANASASVASSPAILTVVLPPSQLQIANVTHAPGTITVPVSLTASGDENALGFSIKYDKTLLTFVEADPGSGSVGASLFVNTNLTGSGELGIALSQPFNTSFTPGAHELVDVIFTTAPITKNTVTPVTFGDQPILRQVSNPQAVIIPATYTDGGITITFPGYEADVSPRPTGDNSLTIVDWVQVGRFVAGLDATSSPGEFQKADCAPRTTLGDGALTVADWVQAGRYVAGLDPLTYAGGPTTPAPTSSIGTENLKLGIGKDSLSRTLTVMDSKAQAGQACQVPIQLAAAGNENGLEFSVVFDPAALSFTGATVGDGATGANLFVNANQAASGQVGVMLALPPGSSFAASNQQVVKLNFVAASSAGGNSSVSFAAQPLPQQTVDSTAADLPVTYVSGTVAITSFASPVLTAASVDGGIVLSWPSSAAGFNLESNPDPTTTNWSSVSSTLVTNATTITTTNPVAGSQMFFRLHHP